MSDVALDQSGIAMKAVYVLFFRAFAMLLVTATTASGAKPTAVFVDVVITYGGQSFGFSGPLRYFDVSDTGGRIGLDLTTLETPGFSPRPNIDGAELQTPGNRWQVAAFIGRSPEVFAGTCAVESFATTVDDVKIQHVYLNCTDLDV